MEEWKDIKGFDGVYQVSNMGRVRTYRAKDGWVGYKLTEEPRIMSLVSHGNGYVYITLVIDGKKQNKYVHRLVAEAFIGDIPKGYVINHIDHNKNNNAVSNLEIITQKQNVDYSKELMKHPKTMSENKCICIRKRGKPYEVTVNKKYLGRYNTIEEARSVRDAYIKEVNYY